MEFSYFPIPRFESWIVYLQNICQNLDSIDAPTILRLVGDPRVSSVNKDVSFIIGSSPMTCISADEHSDVMKALRNKRNTFIPSIYVPWSSNQQNAPDQSSVLAQIITNLRQSAKISPTVSFCCCKNLSRIHHRGDINVISWIYNHFLNKF